MLPSGVDKIDKIKKERINFIKNIETPDKKHLEAIINDLRDGSFGIPDFQRDFEWSPWEVNELIK